MNPQTLRLFVLILLSSLAAPARGGDRPPVTTVVWISVDGIRPDYLDRVETPFFDRLTAEGVFSRAATPLFPTLTFAAHCALATGTAADRHGITGNVIYDSQRNRTYGYPNLPWLLEAEPLWTTAARQGVVTAVFGWPLSHRQAGAHAARYFDPEFNRDLTDAQRLERVLTVWRKHAEPEPLRLLMGYVIGPDTAGHRHGPDAPETAAELALVDALLLDFERDLLAAWEQRRAPGDTLFLMVTSDHGMSTVHTLVHTRMCAGLPARGSPVQLVTGGNIVHYFLNRIDSKADRAELRQSMLEKLGSYDFIDVYERDDLPAAWRFRHPRRTGDIVAVARPGFSFSGRIRAETMAASDFGGPLGMHGYCPEANPDMLTVTFLQRYPEPLGRHDLGQFSMDRLHATAARILGIDPADTAHPDPLPIPGIIGQP